MCPCVCVSLWSVNPPPTPPGPIQTSSLMRGSCTLLRGSLSLSEEFVAFFHQFNLFLRSEGGTSDESGSRSHQNESERLHFAVVSSQITSCQMLGRHTRDS